MELTFTDETEPSRVDQLRTAVRQVLDQEMNGRIAKRRLDELIEAVDEQIAASRVPTGILIELDEEDRAALGHDAAVMTDWFATALLALVKLRGAPLGRLTLTSGTWLTLIGDLEHRLLPRLQGIRDALVRLHAQPFAVLEEPGVTRRGTLDELASAMDAPKSTAQSRRLAVLGRPTSGFEEWARVEGPQDRPRAEGGARCPFCLRRDIIVKERRWDCPRCRRSGPVDEVPADGIVVRELRFVDYEPYRPLGEVEPEPDYRAQYHAAFDRFAEQYLDERLGTVGCAAAWERTAEFKRLYPLAFPQARAAVDRPECTETDYDRRGDCDGELFRVVVEENRGGQRVGEEAWMCGSHARQAVKRGEVRLTGETFTG